MFRRPRSLPWLVSVGVTTVVGLTEGDAFGQADVSGAWRLERDRGTVTITSWGAHCGEQPRSFDDPGGAQWTATPDGDQVVFSGPGVRRRTDGCWSENRAVRRLSAGRTAVGWTVSCATPQTDPRHEHGRYTIDLDGDRLHVRDATHYDWVLEGDHCTLDFTRETLLSRIGGAAPAVRCDAPGPATRLAVEGARRLVPGQRTCLTARGLDANRCPVAVAPFWEIARAPAPAEITIDEEGCVLLAPTYDHRGRIRVVARAGELRGEIALSVARSGEAGAESDLGLADLIPRYEEALEPSSAAPAESAANPGAAAPAGAPAVQLGASPSRAQTDSTLLWPLFFIALTLIVLIVAVLAWLIIRERRRTGDRRRSTTLVVRRPPEAARPQAMLCLTCRREYEPNARFCPFDSTRLASVAEGSAPEAAAAAPGMVCPACHRGYEAGTRFCPHDSEELVPHGLAEASRARAMANAAWRPGGAKGKICPSCASRYDVDATFCGKDGSELVLVN